MRKEMYRGMLKKYTGRKQFLFAQSLNKIYEPSHQWEKHSASTGMLEVLSATVYLSALLTDNLNNFPWEDIFQHY